MAPPAFHAFSHELVDVFEGWSLLPVGIGDVAVALPLPQQEGLSRGFRRLLGDALDVLALHRQHQIGGGQDGRADLARTMRRPVQAMLDEQRLGGGVDAMIDQRPQSGRGNLDVAVAKGVPQHDFGGRTTADIADTHKENMLEHNFQS